MAKSKRVSELIALSVLLALTLAAPSANASIVWAVGDGAKSGTKDDEVAAMIAADNPDTLLYLGDVYNTGTAAEYTDYYEPGYGQLKSKTYPTPGNHEWPNRDTGYFPYWLSRIAGQSYYSFDIGNWHLVSLNSETSYESGSAQVQWLRSDLAQRKGDCTIAYLHRPRFSAGTHGDQAQIDPLWQELKGHAVMVLAGHDHDYQRLSPIDGLTEFVVGTGGASLYAVNSSYQGLAFSNDSEWGALRLDLADERATYSFKALTGSTLDSGTVACDLKEETPPDGPPELTVSESPKRQNLKAALKRGVMVNVGCSESCTLRVRLTLNKKGSWKEARQRLGSAKWSIDGASSKQARVRIFKRARKLLKKRKRATAFITVRALDSAGNSASATAKAVLMT